MVKEAVERALGDATARRVLQVCMTQARAVKEISDATGTPLASTYRHVHQLEEAGLLVVERSAISPDGKRYELYRSRLRSAALALSADGIEVTWATDAGVEERLTTMWRRMRL